MADAYSYDNPSPDYREMVKMYEIMHAEGDNEANKSAANTFPGKMLLEHAPFIRDMIKKTEAKTIMDYGAGKGIGYTARDIKLDTGERAESIQSYWGVEDVRCYDPGYEPFSARPETRYDGVISTDVLEHITQSDVPWVIEDMFALANKFVYGNIACFPAVKNLPNGKNAHCTVKSVDWWAGVVHSVAMRHTNISYRCVMSTKTGPRRKFGFGRNRKTEHHVFERMVKK